MIRLQNTSFDRWQENIERGMSARVNQPSRLHDQRLLTNLTGALEDDQISCVHQRHDLCVCIHLFESAVSSKFISQSGLMETVINYN